MKVFRQRVCGFDLLRTKDRSFVCDVNGWSFVKGNKSYYDMASHIVCDIFLEEMRKRGLSRNTSNRPGKRELKGVIALFRHGDRTPKQKIKIKTSLPVIMENAFGDLCYDEAVEIVHKGTDVPSVPIRHWHTIFQKVVETAGELKMKDADKSKFQAMCDIMLREAEGMKLQIKPQGEGPDGRVSEVQVILKWGGWLTDAGRLQARNLGGLFNKRVLRGNETPHQLDVFTNNERRVKNTAIEFAKTCAGSRKWDESMLNPGERGEIISKSLDDTEKAKKKIEEQKAIITSAMNAETEEECAKYMHLPGFKAVCKLKETPKRAMKDCHHLMLELITHIPDSKELHRGESCGLVRARWTNLAEGFFNKKKDKFDTSKISDIFDYISYDVSYNQEALFPLDLYPLFELAQALNNFVGTGEYGLDPDSRLTIGAQIISPLLAQIQQDVTELQHVEKPRTRLYFSSESHITALYNVLYQSGDCLGVPFLVVADPIQLHYLSHIVLKVYKYNDMEAGAIGRYQMEVLCSVGIDTNAFGIVQDHHVFSITPMIRIHNNLYHHEFEKLVTRVCAITPSTSVSPKHTVKPEEEGPSESETSGVTSPQDSIASPK